MSQPSTAHLQRLLAEEFERRGWEYDLSAGRSIVDEIERTGRVDAPSLAQLVSPGFLARSRAGRGDVAAAIAAALAGMASAVSDRGVEREPLGMRVLFVAAGPADEPRLRLDAEHRDIKARVRAASARSEVAIETALAARPTDLIDELNRFRPTIFHLAGHGGPTGIALEDDTGRSADVTTDQLVRVVAVADPALRLVVLNSCDSAYQAKPVAGHIDAAIGMTRTIGDDSARTFAGQLYSSLAERVPLDRAFEQARLQVSLAGFAEDKTPKLFVRSGVDPASMTFTR